MFLGRLHPSELGDETGLDFNQRGQLAPPIYRNGERIGHITLELRGQHVTAELVQPGDTARSDQLIVSIDGGEPQLMSLRAAMLDVWAKAGRCATKRELMTW